MAADSPAEEALVEEREEEMVAFLGSRVPIKRKGWFLKPSPNSSKPPPPFPPPSSSFNSRYKTSSKSPKCSFKGWVCSFRDWDRWVRKLRPVYADLWRKVGILDAINASLYKFGRDPSSLWGVARFWCAETNTFLFPWAEATVTLEDVMVLGGYSVLGEPVRVDGATVDDELKELEGAMIREMRKFNQTKSKKPDVSTWTKHYVEEGDGGEVEHTAFLALWLSKFVLAAHPMRTIGYHVIPVAVRLARGRRIALAPAVLASIYHDLRQMKDYLSNKPGPDKAPLVVWAPLHIVQVWIWERILSLRPDPSSAVSPDEPRAARWHGVGKKLDYEFVMSAIKSQDEIQWRPYLNGPDGWRKPSYIRNDGGWVVNSEATPADEGLESYARCLRACELVGIGCIEQYLPHRVARQFGLDQGIPQSVPRANSTWEVAWRTYEIGAKSVKFYIPPRQFESDVTLEYSVWWDGVQRLLKKKMKGKKRRKIRTLKSCNEKDGHENDDTTLSEWLALKNQHISSLQKCEAPPGTKKDADSIQEDGTHAKLCGELKESLEPTESMKQPVEISCNTQVETGAIEASPMDTDDNTVAGCVEDTSNGNGVHISSQHECENPPDTLENATVAQDHQTDTRNTETFGETPSLEVPIEANPTDADEKRSTGRVEETNAGVCSSSLHDCDNPPENATDVQDHHTDSRNGETGGQNSSLVVSEAIEDNPMDVDNKGVVVCVEETSPHEHENPPESSENPTVVQDQRTVMENGEKCGGKLSLELSEATKQDPDRLVGTEVENGPATPNPLATEEKGVVECNKETRAGGCNSEPAVVEEHDENFKMEVVEESVEDVSSGVAEEIEKLKEEIALIHARVKELESRTEVRH